MSNNTFAKNIEYLLRTRGISSEQMILDLGLPRDTILNLSSKLKYKEQMAEYFNSDIPSLYYFDLSLPSECEGIASENGRNDFIKKTIEKFENRIDKWRILSRDELKNEYFSGRDAFRIIGFRFETEEYYLDSYAMARAVEKKIEEGCTKLPAEVDKWARITIYGNEKFNHRFCGKSYDIAILLDKLLNHFQIDFDDWYTDWTVFFDPDYAKNYWSFHKKEDRYIDGNNALILYEKRVLAEEFGDDYKNNHYLFQCLDSISKELKKSSFYPIKDLIHEDNLQKEFELNCKQYKLIKNKTIVIESKEEAQQFILDVIGGSLSEKLSGNPIDELVRVWHYFWKDKIDIWDITSVDWIISHQWFLWIKDYYTIATTIQFKELYQKMGVNPITWQEKLKKTSDLIKHGGHVWNSVSHKGKSLDLLLDEMKQLLKNVEAIENQDYENHDNYLIRVYSRHKELQNQSNIKILETEEWKETFRGLYFICLYNMIQQLPSEYRFKEFSEGMIFVSETVVKQNLFPGLKLQKKTMKVLWSRFVPHFVTDNTFVQWDIKNDGYVLCFSSGHFEKKKYSDNLYLYFASIITRIIEKQYLSWLGIDMEVSLDKKEFERNVPYLSFDGNILIKVQDIIKDTVRNVLMGDKDIRWHLRIALDQMNSMSG